MFHFLNIPLQIDTQGNAAKAADKGKKYKNLPDNLVRHQFLSLLVRVSKDKYLRSK